MFISVWYNSAECWWTIIYLSPIAWILFSVFQIRKFKTSPGNRKYKANFALISTRKHLLPEDSPSGSFFFYSMWGNALCNFCCVVHHHFTYYFCSKTDNSNEQNLIKMFCLVFGWTAHAVRLNMVYMYITICRLHNML